MTRPGQPDLFASNAAPVQDGAVAFGSPSRNPDDGLLRRLLEHGPRALAEGEALTMLLRRCAPACRDPGTAAQALLVRFGSWPRILGATLPELARVVGEPVACDLKLVQDLMLRALEFEVRKRPVLSSTGAVLAYLRLSLGGQARESFRVLFLDKANQLIADEVMGDGTVDHAPVYPREVMRRALELNASACCLAHNHPTGGSTPSGADIEMTRRTVEAGHTIGVAVHDHFLVGGDDVVSFKALGLM